MTPFVLIADIDRAVMAVTTVVVKINKIDSPEKQSKPDNIYCVNVYYRFYLRFTINWPCLSQLLLTSSFSLSLGP